MINAGTPQPTGGIVVVPGHSFMTKAPLIKLTKDPENCGCRCVGNTLEWMTKFMLEWEFEERLSIVEMMRMPDKQYTLNLMDLTNFIEWRFRDARVPGCLLSLKGNVMGLKIKKWVHGKYHVEKQKE